MIKLKDHARKALREARKTAKASGPGLDVQCLGLTGGDHYRFAVVDGDKELGRFTISASPKSKGDMVNFARQLTRRAIREALA